jgi:3-oxoacyl-[acyl-carrier-protein] synthase-3
MVFGDAGSATLVEKGTGNISFNIMTNGSGSMNLIIPAGGCRNPKNEDTEMMSVGKDGNLRSPEDLFLDGVEVMNFSVREVPKSIYALLNHIGWEKSDVDFFGFHQANRFIVDYIRKIMKLQRDIVPITMGETGNTGSASIPLMLARESKRFFIEGKPRKSVLCGYGVGLSCASAVLDLSQTEFFEPIEV